VISLLRAELLRLRSRRLYHILGAIAVALLILIGVLVFRHYGMPGQSLEYRVAVRNGIRIAADLLFSLSVVVGASAVGAEWTSGGMSTLLVWEPRRDRVFETKLASVVIGVFAAALATIVLMGVMLVPTAAAHGTFAGMTGLWWRTTLGMWLRASTVAAVGGAIGVGLAYLMRNAAGPVATWLIFQFVAAQALTLWKPGWFRWMPEGNLQQFVGSFGRAEINGTQLLPTTSVLRGGLVLGAYAAGLLAIGFASFRARDVT
jgi:hypothetical protein